MIQSKSFAGFLLVALLVGGAGCAGSPAREQTGEYVADTVITANVKAAIVKDPSLASAAVGVETFQGVVHLTGFVGTQADLDHAAGIARHVAGVKSVRNDVRLR